MDSTVGMWMHLSEYQNPSDIYRGERSFEYENLLNKYNNPIVVNWGQIENLVNKVTSNLKLQ